VVFVRAVSSSLIGKFAKNFTVKVEDVPAKPGSGRQANIPRLKRGLYALYVSLAKISNVRDSQPSADEGLSPTSIGEVFDLPEHVAEIAARLVCHPAGTELCVLWWWSKRVAKRPATNNIGWQQAGGKSLEESLQGVEGRQQLFRNKVTSLSSST
jgi:hypothetical protein